MIKKNFPLVVCKLKRVIAKHLRLTRAQIFEQDRIYGVKKNKSYKIHDICQEISMTNSYINKIF